MIPDVSAFIVCKNEEHNIRRCLASITWCREIIVIDSGSTDKTLEICAEYGVKVIHRSWPGYVIQKRFGLEQCTSTWVLNLDADEEVSPELRQEIERALKENQNSGVDGFNLSRVVFYLGRWWRKGGWYPEYRLRLCRRSNTTWGGHDPHERAIVKGKVKRLRGELRHYTYRNMADHVERLHRYATSAAQTMYEQKRNSSLLNMIFNPIMRFIKFYFLKRGFLEGKPGFLVAQLESYYVFLKYAKLWELYHNHPPEAE